MEDPSGINRQLQFRGGHPVGWEDIHPIQVRQHIAVHEAGHVVVGLVYDMPFVDVDIRLDPVAH